jgi:catechol 2,3-dioxygenase
MARDVIHPMFHHVTLTTTRLPEMIDFYAVLVGAEVIHRDAVGAWLTNDRANQRIALLAAPHVAGEPAHERHTGLHHTAYEYASLDELNASYLHLKDAGIEPAFCVDHGMTLSYYYAHPDGNYVELQIDAFGDWAWSKAWMKNSRSSRPTRSASSWTPRRSPPTMPPPSRSRLCTPRR